MKNNEALFFLSVVMIFVLGVSLAFAATPDEASVVSNSDLGEFASSTADNISTEAGNITWVDLNTNMSTFKWVGLLGNTSGTIILGDSSGNRMHEWIADGQMVYASQSASVTWASLADASEADIVGYYAYLANGSSDRKDSYARTFNESAENINSTIFTTLTSDFCWTFDDTASYYWKTYSLHDTADAVWAGLVREDQNDFRNNSADFQMILPEDGTAGDTTAQDYNLWIELI